MFFSFDESGSVGGTVCVEIVALWKDETERAFEKYKVKGGERNGR